MPRGIGTAGRPNILATSPIWLAPVAAPVVASPLADFLDGIEPAWLYLLAFVAAFGESTPAFGLLIPGQTILFVAGFVSGEGLLDPFLLAVIVAAGGFLGDTLGYVVGRRWGIKPMRVFPRRLRPGPHAQQRLTLLFERHGMKAIILARFQPIGRAFGPYFAGVSGMSTARFIGADAVASLAASACLVGLGYLAGLGFERLSKTIGVVAVSVVTVLLVIVVAIGLRVKHQKEKAVDIDDLVTP